MGVPAFLCILDSIVCYQLYGSVRSLKCLTHTNINLSVVGHVIIIPASDSIIHCQLFDIYCIVGTEIYVNTKFIF